MPAAPREAVEEFNKECLCVCLCLGGEGGQMIHLIAVLFTALRRKDCEKVRIFTVAPGCSGPACGGWERV